MARHDGVQAVGDRTCNARNKESSAVTMDSFEETTATIQVIQLRTSRERNVGDLGSVQRQPQVLPHQGSTKPARVATCRRNVLVKESPANSNRTNCYETDPITPSQSLCLLQTRTSMTPGQGLYVSELQHRPEEVLMMEASTLGSAPSLTPSPMASATALMEIPSTRLLHSFAT